MREIKFRGRTPKGEIVIGDLTHCKGHVFIDDTRVDPDSVAQFCGFDSDGNEVFEGDKVIALNYYNKEYAVELVPMYGLFKNLDHCRKK